MVILTLFRDEIISEKKENACIKVYIFGAIIILIYFCLNFAVAGVLSELHNTEVLALDITCSLTMEWL